MKDDIRSFGTALGQGVVARHRAGAHGLLALWLQSSLSVDDVRARSTRTRIGRVLEENGVEGMQHPEEFHIGGNSEMTAKELHSPVGSWSDHVRPVSELVNLNLRYRLRLALKCSNEQAEDPGSTSSRMCG